MFSDPQNSRLRALAGVAAVLGALASGGCAAGSTGGADCDSGPACAHRGWCGWDVAEGRCAAIDASHCEASQVCADRGACTVLDGQCVVADADCRKRPTCREEGRCHARGAACVAIDDADCSGAVACTRQGRCTAVNGRCQRAEKVAVTPPVAVGVVNPELPEVCQQMMVCLSRILAQTGQKPTMVKSMTEALMSLKPQEREKTCEQALKNLPRNSPCP